MKVTPLALEIKPLTEKDFGYTFCKDKIFKVVHSQAQKDLEWCLDKEILFSELSKNGIIDYNLNYTIVEPDGSYDIDNLELSYIAKTKYALSDLANFHQFLINCSLNPTYILTDKLKTSDFIKEASIHLSLTTIQDFKNAIRDILHIRHNKVTFADEKAFIKSIKDIKIKSKAHIEQIICDIWLDKRNTNPDKNLIISDFIEISDNEVLALFNSKKQLNLINGRELLKNSLPNSKIEEGNILYLGKYTDKPDYYLYLMKTPNQNAALKIRIGDTIIVEEVGEIRFRHQTSFRSERLVQPLLNNIIKSAGITNYSSNDNNVLTLSSISDLNNIIDHLRSHCSSAEFLPVFKTSPIVSTYDIYTNLSAEVKFEPINKLLLQLEFTVGRYYNSHDNITDLSNKVINFFSFSNDLKQITQLLAYNETIEVRLKNLSKALEIVYNILYHHLCDWLKVKLDCVNSIDRAYLVIDAIENNKITYPEKDIQDFNAFKNSISNSSINNVKYSFDDLNNIVFGILLQTALKMHMETSCFLNFNKKEKSFHRPEDVIYNLLTLNNNVERTYLLKSIYANRRTQNI